MWRSLKQMILSVFNRSYECLCKYIFVELILWYFFCFITSVRNKVNLTNELKKSSSWWLQEMFSSSFYTVLRDKRVTHTPTSPILKITVALNGEKSSLAFYKAVIIRSYGERYLPDKRNKYDDIIVNSPNIVLKCSSCEWIWNWLFGWTEFCNENFNLTLLHITHSEKYMRTTKATGLNGLRSAKKRE